MNNAEQVQKILDDHPNAPIVVLVDEYIKLKEIPYTGTRSGLEIKRTISRQKLLHPKGEVIALMHTHDYRGNKKDNIVEKIGTDLETGEYASMGLFVKEITNEI